LIAFAVGGERRTVTRRRGPDEHRCITRDGDVADESAFALRVRRHVGPSAAEVDSCRRSSAGVDDRAWKCARQMVPTITGGLVCTETAKRIDAERLARGPGARGAAARVRFDIDDLQA